METNNNPQSEKTNKKKRINQVLFLEYETPTDTGHKLTVLDSYRNILGRIFEKYDEEAIEFECTFIDADGNEWFKTKNLPELKDMIIKNKKVMLERAYERRLEKFKDIKLKKEVEKAQSNNTLSDKKEIRKQTKQVKETFSEKEPDKKELEETIKKSIRQEELNKLREKMEQNKQQTPTR
jgi:hypothetical protein